MMSPWCVMLTPQPFSLPAGERHHRPCTLGEGGELAEVPVPRSGTVTERPPPMLSHTLMFAVREPAAVGRKNVWIWHEPPGAMSAPTLQLAVQMKSVPEHNGSFPHPEVELMPVMR